MTGIAYTISRVKIGACGVFEILVGGVGDSGGDGNGGGGGGTVVLVLMVVLVWCWWR